MKHKAIEKTSIILLSKSTAILGSIVIAFVSIVTGYLLGVSSVDMDHTQKKEETKKTDVVPADDKRVLEPTTANATPPAAAQQQSQPIKPIIMPKEPVFVPVPQAAQQPVQPQTQKQLLPQTQQNQPQQQMQPVPQQQLQQMQPAPQKQMQQSEVFPAKKQQSDRSLLKSTQNDMKMPLIRGEAAAPAPTVKTLPKPTPAKKAVQANADNRKQLTKKSRAASAAGKYTIQFGAFPSKDGAENLKKRLSSKNINAYILNRKDPNDYYRVRSGSYPTKEAAAKAAAALKAKTGIDNFIAQSGR